MDIRELLENEANKRNSCDELDYSRADPLMVAKRYGEEHIALTCALFAYGNAKQIVKFLDSIDFALFLDDFDAFLPTLEDKYYRFQKNRDVIEWFRTLQQIRDMGGLESIFMDGYKNGDVIAGIAKLIDSIYDLNPYRSYGYEFLISKPIKNISKASAMKRWFMYLRWMVRSDELDMGLWSRVDTKDLLMPLDTHTFNISRKLGLLNRKQCDLHASIELTEKLREFDASDPIKYDFALYRIGQEKLLDKYIVGS